MESIKNHIAEAYVLISKIPVSGDSVDLMASARYHLRTIAQIVAEKEKKTECAGGATDE